MAPRKAAQGTLAAPQNPTFTGSEAEIRLARYRQVEREADMFGRILGVRRLKPSERGKLQGMTADLTGHTDAVNEKGQPVKVPHWVPYFISAAVCEIDGLPIPFPKNRAELDAIYDRLDEEGIEAALKAATRLSEVAGAVEDPLEEAKKS